MAKKQKPPKAESAPAPAPAEAPPQRLELVEAGKLKSNPRNWRKHPPSQIAAFQAVLNDVGFISPVLLNETTGHLLDGHMRAASVPPTMMIPVLVGRWSLAQEKEILATYNPIAGLAEIDPENTRALLAQVQSKAPAVQAMLELLEKQLEQSGALDEEPDDEADDDDEEGGGGGEAVEVEQTFAIMVRCVDKLDQMTLVKRLSADGLEAQEVQT